MKRTTKILKLITLCVSTQVNRELSSHTIKLQFQGRLDCNCKHLLILHLAPIYPSLQTQVTMNLSLLFVLCSFFVTMQFSVLSILQLRLHLPKFNDKENDSIKLNRHANTSILNTVL